MAKTHIMKSVDMEKLAGELRISSVPKMMFGDNILRIQHGSSLGIEFNATNALRYVNNYQECLKWPVQKSGRKAGHEVDTPKTLLNH